MRCEIEFIGRSILLARARDFGQWGRLDLVGD